MGKHMRVPLIAANWKMNFNSLEAEAFVREFKKRVHGVSGVEIVICAPFTSLQSLHSVLSSTNIRLGAQNMFYEEEGTFTGEISAGMLSPYCRYVIVGHSERRKHFNESNQDINRKVKRALSHSLVPIVCIGESFEERTAGKTNTVLKEQLTECLKGCSSEEAAKIVLAYEPIWAISKGKTNIAKSPPASPETAQQAHSFIRSLVSKSFGSEAAEKTRILYGGSVKPDNVKQLMVQADIDGGLVGAASLDPKSFSAIARFRG